MKKRRKLLMIFIASFIAGLLIGVAGGYLGAKQFGRRPRPSRKIIKNKLIEHLETSVKLDEKQKAEVGKILDDHFKKMSDFYKQSIPKMKEYQTQLFKDLQAQMRPDQLASFEEFKKSFLNKISRRMSNYGNMKHHPRRKNPGPGPRFKHPEKKLEKTEDKAGLDNAIKTENINSGVTEGTKKNEEKIDNM